MHPTGMHSCLFMLSNIFSQTSIVFIFEIFGGHKSFLSTDHCKTQEEFSDLLEKGRIY